MKSDKDHIKDIFSSKLQGFEADLPPSLWDKIEADLPAQPSIKVPVKKPVYRILSWSAAAAAVILAVLYFMPQYNDDTAIARLIENNTPERKSRSLAELKIEDQKEITISKVIIQPVKVQSTFALLASSSTVGQFTSNTKIISSVEMLPKNADAEDNSVAVDGDTNVKSQAVQNEYVAESGNQENFQAKDPDFERDLAAKIAAFEAAGENSKNVLADNNIPAKSTKKEKKSQGMTLGVEGGSGLVRSDDVANTFRYANPLLATEGLYTVRSQKFKLEHNQPISFGIAVNKKINNKLSIESGIVYTYVSAKIRLEGKSEYNQNDQQYFHYFGIPLSLNYKFAEWKKAEFYTSLGGMIQKDFYGRITSESSIDDLINSKRSSERNISQSKPQFSATALMGIAYPIYNKLSVYTTFGGAYYFQANNEYETIYSDRKWLFNFNLGLKFGF